MCVDANALHAVAPGGIVYTAEEKGRNCSASIFGRYCRAVQDAVGQIRRPFSVRDIIILRRRKRGECKDARNLLSVENHIALPSLHIGKKGFPVWIIPLPLINSTLLQHIPGICSNGENGRKILRHRMPAAERLIEHRPGGIFADLFQQLPIFRIGDVQLLKHIRPLVHGAKQLLLSAPALNFCMVTVAKDLRNLHALPFLRSGVLGIFQKAVPMALTGVAFRIGENTGHKAAYRVSHGHRCNLSAGEHKVSQRELLIHALFDKAFIHTFIVATDQNKMVIVVSQAFSRFLGKGFTLG